MSRLRNAIDRLWSEVCALHAELTRYELVIWTAGNVSTRISGENLMIIKLSGLVYDELTPDAMVVTDLHGTPWTMDGAVRT